MAGPVFCEMAFRKAEGLIVRFRDNKGLILPSFDPVDLSLMRMNPPSTLSLNCRSRPLLSLPKLLVFLVIK